jgi:hypothetical protein
LSSRQQYGGRRPATAAKATRPVNSTITTATDARMPMAEKEGLTSNGAAGYTSTAGHISRPQQTPAALQYYSPHSDFHAGKANQ